MQRFKNILVAVDQKTENRAVVERAVTLAQRNQARLMVVNTVKELPCPAPASDIPEPLLDIGIDWYADDFVENPYGSEHSVVDLTEVGEPSLC